MASQKPSNRPSLIFELPNRPPFGWTDFLHVTTLGNEEIEQLLLECNYAKAVLQKECDRRQTQGEPVPMSQELYTVLKRNQGRARNRDTTPQPSDETTWLIARLTGSHFQFDEARLSTYEKASLVSLSMNLANYPGAEPIRLEAARFSSQSCYTVFPTLSKEDRQLASLIFFAGNDVPHCFLSTASFRWSENGEIEFQECSLPGSIKSLKDKGIAYEKTKGTYSVSEAAVEDSKDEFWKVKVLEHICRIFPKDSHMAPTNYTQTGYALLPILRHVANHFYNLGASRTWEYSMQRAALETFLSATQFGDLSWKLQAMRASEELVLLSNDPISRARVEIRRLALRRLFPSVLTHQQTFRGLHDCRPHGLATNKRSNAFLGQLELIEVQALIDDKASAEDVWWATKRFQPFDKNNVSSQENLILLELYFLYAKSLRYWGRIEEANVQFQSLLKLYTKDKVNQAIQDVLDGASTRQASRRWGVPRSTIHNRIHGIQSRDTAFIDLQRLSQTQESKLAS
ncbi:hypothetical protein CSUB01_05958 [Colletotrichum sublineola]|uniref:HTH psq-type domain-containing protein n=1 Tax=Colletotrichum sublineola TaxID=1173701 RepID=A0A066X4V3_COLSU|nr:hypothetical protein CSUB01_05958 [Colletotrichum sublineola]